jgi:hypothetical protein
LIDHFLLSDSRAASEVSFGGFSASQTAVDRVFPAEEGGWGDIFSFSRAGNSSARLFFFSNQKKAFFPSAYKTWTMERPLPKSNRKFFVCYNVEFAGAVGVCNAERGSRRRRTISKEEEEGGGEVSVMKEAVLLSRCATRACGGEGGKDEEVKPSESHSTAQHSTVIKAALFSRI